MESSHVDEQDQLFDEDVDTNEDRYPSLSDVLVGINQRVAVTYSHVERVEITCLANGDATYRVWSPRAEEPEGGFIPGPQTYD